MIQKTEAANRPLKPPCSQFPFFSKQQLGFSLVEMMIVLIIAGFFISYGANKIGDRSSKVKSTIRRFGVIVKKMRNRARIDNKTYRLVFDLPVDSKKQQSYWAESTDKKALLLNKDQREELEDQMEDDNKNLKEGQPKPDPQGFVTDTRVIKNPPSTLPDGLYFESIEIDGDPIEKIQEGRVYIYFFPQGQVQTSAIHITDRDKHNWTLAIRGLTGKVLMLPKYRSLEDVWDQ